MASAPSANGQPAKITVHWLEKSRAQRLLWLLEECNIPYAIKVYKRAADHLAPPEMKAVHPLGKSPVLTIEVPGRSESLVLAESGMIFESLVSNHAQHLAPEVYEGRIGGETESWLRYRYYMHYCEGSFMSLLVRVHDLHGIEGPGVENIATKLRRNLHTHLAFLESQIKSAPDDGSYLCGKALTAADILMSFPLLVVQASMGGLAEYPGLESYVEFLTGSLAYKESVEKVEKISGEKYVVV